MRGASISISLVVAVFASPLASSRRVQTGCLLWTRASSSHGSLSKQWATMGSIRGLSGSQKFETCPGWGANQIIHSTGFSSIQSTPSIMAIYGDFRPFLMVACYSFRYSPGTRIPRPAPVPHMHV